MSAQIYIFAQGLGWGYKPSHIDPGYRCNKTHAWD